MPSKRKQQVKGKTVAELAKQFGKSGSAMRSLCLELRPVGKKSRANTYDPKAVAGLLSSKIERSQKPMELKELERRKVELQCKKLEIEIDTVLRKLVPVDEVVRHVQSMITQVRTHLLSMPAECAPLVVGHDDRAAEKIMREHHLKMLEKLQVMRFE